MVSKALGLIETVGLAAALEAADAALKAANIELMGYELTNGGGMVLVRFSGNVGAIKMAVEAGRLAAGKVGKVVATHVIPRPHQQLSCVLLAKEIPPGKVQAAKEMETDLQVATEVTIDLQVATNIENEIPEESEAQLQPEQELQEEKAQEKKEIDLALGSIKRANENKDKGSAELCNFCHDPACHRKKGDPKVNCIHYGKNNEEAE